MMNNELIFGTGASAAKDYEGLNKVVSCAISCGIRTFDTAPSYGVEGILADVLLKNIQKQNLKREDFCVQTKIDAWHMMDGNIEMFVDKALQKMNLWYLCYVLFAKHTFSTC